MSSENEESFAHDALAARTPLARISKPPIIRDTVPLLTFLQLAVEQKIGRLREVFKDVSFARCLPNSTPPSAVLSPQEPPPWTNPSAPAPAAETEARDPNTGLPRLG